MERDKIIMGDAIELLKSIPDGSIDLVATDPPYKLTSRGSSGTMSGYWATDMARKGKVFEHNDIEIDEYLPEFYRVLKADAHCYIMCNNLNLPHFFEVVGKSKFHFVKLLVWDKVQAICGKYYMGQVEHIFMLRKGKDKPVNDCGVSDILTFPNKKDRRRNGSNVHDSQKPVALFQTLITQSTEKGGIVLDPFMGSGTTAIAAYRTGRHFIGFEKDETYYRSACERYDRESKGISVLPNGKTVIEQSLF